MSFVIFGKAETLKEDIIVTLIQIQNEHVSEILFNSLVNEGTIKILIKTGSKEKKCHTFIVKEC